MTLEAIEQIANRATFEVLAQPVVYTKQQGGAVSTRVKVYRQHRRAGEMRNGSRFVNRVEVHDFASIPVADVPIPRRDDTFVYAGQTYAVEHVEHIGPTRVEVQVRRV